jgi:hypothetical protein
MATLARFLKGLNIQCATFDDTCLVGIEGVTDVKLHLDVSEPLEKAARSKHTIYRTHHNVVYVKLETNSAQILASVVYDTSVGIFDAPVVRVLTPNGLYMCDVPICINGMTHYHQDTYDKTLRVGSLVNALMLPLLSRPDFEHMKSSNFIGLCTDSVFGLPTDTREHNAAHYADVVNLFPS